MKKILSTTFVALGALLLAACSPTTSNGDTTPAPGGSTDTPSIPTAPTRFKIDNEKITEDKVVTEEEWRAAFDLTDPSTALASVTKFTFETTETEGYETEYDITQLDITDPTSYYVYELDREIDRYEVEEEEYLLTKNADGRYISFEVERKGTSVDNLRIEEVELDGHDDGKIAREVEENLADIRLKALRDPYHLKTGLYTDKLTVTYYIYDDGFAFEATFVDTNNIFDDDDDDIYDTGNVEYTIYITYNTDGLLTSIILSEEHENSLYSEYEEKVITYNADFERKTSLVTQ